MRNDLAIRIAPLLEFMPDTDAHGLRACSQDPKTAAKDNDDHGK